MAANYTENLHLPQWDALDPFKRTEFNEAFAAIDEAVSLKANIEFGSYTGTGKYGANNPNTLSFRFLPKIIFIVRKSAGDGDAFMTFVQGQPVSCYNRCNTYDHAVHLTWGGNSVSWYCTTNATYQFNNGDFLYVAIG